VNDTAEIYRQRLMDISWFMRVLNEDIARKANQEDGCTGRFWEGRFKSQALLDEAALVACMAYVDLNPIRAKMAISSETSDYTSVQLRLRTAINHEQPLSLLPFIGNPKQKVAEKGLPFALIDYLELIELTGRCMKENKRGYIEAHVPALIQRLGICPENWLTLTSEFRKVFHGAIGHEEALQRFCQHKHIQKSLNLTASRALFA
jgi:hypothetical protein